MKRARERGRMPQTGNSYKEDLKKCKSLHETPLVTFLEA